jgi:hypothetical protein
MDNVAGFDSKLAFSVTYRPIRLRDVEDPRTGRALLSRNMSFLLLVLISVSG